MHKRSESVTMFLRDPMTSDLSAGAQMAYECVTATSNSHPFTYVVGVNMYHAEAN